MDNVNNNDTKTERKKSHQMLLDMIYTALFAALIAVCSQIQLPIGTIPVTLQTLAVFTAAGIGGTRRGTMSVLIYILLGIVGLPVFAGFTGGIGIVAGPTGGYIIGFLLTALTVGLITEKAGKKIWVLLLSMTAGLLLCYIFGTAWFIIISNSGGSTMDVFTALSYCVIPFLIPDAAKIIISAIIVNRLDKAVKL